MKRLELFADDDDEKRQHDLADTPRIRGRSCQVFTCRQTMFIPRWWNEPVVSHMITTSPKLGGSAPLGGGSMDRNESIEQPCRS